MGASAAFMHHRKQQIFWPPGARVTGHTQGKTRFMPKARVCFKHTGSNPVVLVILWLTSVLLMIQNGMVLTQGSKMYKNLLLVRYK
jgi:hypothetical protein